MDLLIKNINKAIIVSPIVFLNHVIFIISHSNALKVFYGVLVDHILVRLIDESYQKVHKDNENDYLLADPHKPNHHDHEL